MARSAARLIEDYLWHVKEYDEWDQRFYVGGEPEGYKQKKALEEHEQAATLAWEELEPLWGRRIIVDGVVYLIREDDADREWNKMIVEQKEGVYAGA